MRQPRLPCSRYPSRSFRARTFAVLLIASAFPPLAGGESAAQASPVASEVYAFEGVTVIPMTGPRTLPDHTVIVRDGRIAEVSPSAAAVVPADAVRIAGEGRYLIPALADMHARLPAEDDPLRVVVLEEALFLYLANGITRIRTMSGAPYQLQLREEIARGDVLGPTIYTGAPTLHPDSMGEAGSVEAQVRSRAQEEYDLLTIDQELPRSAWEETVRSAAQVGISYAGRVPAAVGSDQVLASGISNIDYLDGFLEATRRTDIAAEASSAERYRATDPAKLRDVAAKTAAGGTYVVPLQYVQNHLFGWNAMLGGWVEPDSVVALPEFSYVPQSQRDTWATTAWNRWSGPAVSPESARAYADWRRELVAALYAAGASILLGAGASDLFNVPGFALHREMPLLVAAGMTPYEVLEAGTRTPARYAEAELDQPGDFGAVVPGYSADLLLLDEDPIESVAALQARVGVMVQGRWLSEEDIATRLATIAERHKDYEID